LSIWKTNTLTNIHVNVVIVFYVCSKTSCEMLQTLIISWLTRSLKKMKKLAPRKPKFQQPSTLEPINHNKRSLTTPKFEESKTLNPITQFYFCETLVFYSLLSLIAFVIKHIVIWLLMDPSMLWHIYHVNKIWFGVMGNTTTWGAFEFVKINNVYYYWTIFKHGLMRHYLKVQLQFELECLQFCVMVSDSHYKNSWFFNFKN
jgi:hypothetical protein